MKAVVEFDRVRDCPHWAEGTCLLDDCSCQEEEIAPVPIDCPLGKEATDGETTD